MILVQELSKIFNTKTSAIKAVDNISFNINLGERVAFIGPNGAGKSTTIKMLVGIMAPTHGKIALVKLNPHIERERQKLAYQIGVIFGQRSQLWHNLSARDAFYMLGAIYDLSNSQISLRCHELANSFGVSHLLDKPVRQLSLGERMRCELICSLLHNPKLLFLDEPTIGLDFESKARVRDVLKFISLQYGTSIILTSHDTGDIEGLCEKAIVIDHGKLIFNDSLQQLKQQFVKEKILLLHLNVESITWDYYGTSIIEQKPHYLAIKVDLLHASITAVINYVLNMGVLQDVSINDPSLEDIITRVYKSYVSV